MRFPPSPWVVLKKNLQTFCSCYHQKKLKTLWWCCEFNDFFCKLTKMKLMPTLISTLETSKLSHTVCCSMHHCSPAVLFCCKCWDEQLNRPGPGLSPARRRALLCIHMLASFMMMNGASRSRTLKNQEHWYCTPAMAHSVLEPLPSLQPQSNAPGTITTAALTQKYSTCQYRQWGTVNKDRPWLSWEP